MNSDKEMNLILGKFEPLGKVPLDTLRDRKHVSYSTYFDYLMRPNISRSEKIGNLIAMVVPVFLISAMVVFTTWVIISRPEERSIDALVVDACFTAVVILIALLYYMMGYNTYLMYNSYLRSSSVFLIPIKSIGLDVSKMSKSNKEFARALLGGRAMLLQVMRGTSYSINLEAEDNYINQMLRSLASSEDADDALQIRVLTYLVYIDTMVYSRAETMEFMLRLRSESEPTSEEIEIPNFRGCAASLKYFLNRKNINEYDLVHIQ